MATEENSQVVEAPVTSAAVVEATPAAAPSSAPAVEAAATVPSLLGAEATPSAETKNAQESQVAQTTEATPKENAEAPVKDAPKVDADAVKEPAEQVAPTYEPFKLPESLKDKLQADEKVLGDLTGLLGKLELAKGDRVASQEIGQQIVDLGSNLVAKALEDQTKFYLTLHDKQKNDEFEALRKDPAIGNGDDKRFQQFGRDMANFLAANGGSKEEVTAFRQFVDERGVANALPLVRLLNNLKTKIEGYQKETSSMLPGTKPASGKPQVGKGIMRALYGGGNK